MNFLKKTLSAGIALSCLISLAGGLSFNSNFSHVVKAANNIIAFPGAVGGGKYATGGRGGEVVHVTNLNDSGAGSFRDAVSKSNRIVVFDVSGTIELKSNILCQSNITIAGQTAPGGAGITLKNYKMGMSGNNIICRYISSRPGPYNATSSGNDAWGGAAGSNSIIDHCSLGWSSDEQWGLYSKNDNYTLQYSVIGPANSWGGHAKGIHGFGIMFGRSNFSFDHNLIIHNVSRNFRGKVTDQNSADFTNNVIYDWGYQTAYGTIGHVNYVNNTLKAGNSTAGGYHYIQVSNSDNFKVYLSGNRILNKDGSIKNDVDKNWNAMSYKSGKTQAGTKVDSHFPVTTNSVDVSTVLTAESTSDSFDHVVSYAGNGISPTQRTAIDQQCAEETRNGTGSCSGTAAYNSSVTDLDKYKIQCGISYKYPSAIIKKTITDNDNDGMDDNWELARGLNPNDPSDTKGDYCGKGYTNIEYYINDLTVNSFPKGVVELSPTSRTPVTTTKAPVQTTATTTTSAPSKFNLKDNAYYMIKNKNSGLYMEVEGGNATNSANVQQWGASGSANHNTWQIVPSGDGYYYLYSQVGDKSYVLDITGKKATDGTNVEIYSYRGTDNQKFKLSPNSDGSYKILTKVSGDKSAVEVKDALTTSGANVQEWTINGATCQDWIFEEVDSSKFTTLATTTVTTTATPQITSSPVTTTTARIRPMGDIDGDYIVDSLDAYIIQDLIILQKKQEPMATKDSYSDITVYGDMNKDGKINSKDLVLIKRYISN